MLRRALTGCPDGTVRLDQALEQTDDRRRLEAGRLKACKLAWEGPVPPPRLDFVIEELQAAAFLPLPDEEDPDL